MTLVQGGSEARSLQPRARRLAARMECDAVVEKQVNRGDARDGSTLTTAAGLPVFRQPQSLGESVSVAAAGVGDGASSENCFCACPLAPASTKRVATVSL